MSGYAVGKGAARMVTNDGLASMTARTDLISQRIIARVIGKEISKVCEIRCDERRVA